MWIPRLVSMICEMRACVLRKFLFQHARRIGFCFIILMSACTIFTADVCFPLNYLSSLEWLVELTCSVYVYYTCLTYYVLFSISCYVTCCLAKSQWYPIDTILSKNNKSVNPWNRLHLMIYFSMYCDENFLKVKRVQLYPKNCVSLWFILRLHK